MTSQASQKKVYPEPLGSARDELRRRVRVRIAPSPTGFAHVGTAYTALFNYAFARKNKGKFVLRLEDTDVKRQVKGAEQAIYDGLSWLGLGWDEGPDKGGEYGPYRQSERLDIYKKRVQKLIEKDLAYQDEGAVKFKSKFKSKEKVGWNDLIRGKIEFPASEIGDFVLLKSNGYPTYNFAVVIDDSLMKISHVIRAEEHISNTPRQIVLYKALGFDKPEFAHFPLLRNEDKSKISKRKNPVSLSWYKKQGYLPGALINFLCLLGWSHPEEKEIFDLKEFVEKFSLGRVRKAGPVFNLKKLDWMNGEYIRKTQNVKLKTQIFEFFSKKYSEEKIEEILPLVKDRIKTLKEFESLAGFFFKARKPKPGIFEKDYKKHIRALIKTLENTESWEGKNIDKILFGLVDKNGFHTGGFFMNLRVAITGSRFTPPINESIVILGREETISRLKSILSN